LVWLAAGIVLGWTAAALAAPVPRILVVGDSWAVGMTSFGNFDQALASRGLSNIGVVRAAVWGSTAVGWVDARRDPPMSLISDQMTSNPTIDCVMLQIGVNDYLGLATRVNLAALTPVERNAQYDPIVAAIRSMIEFIHGVRPTANIVVSGYDYLVLPAITSAFGFTYNGLTVAQFNSFLVELEARKRDLCRELMRTAYVQNFGLLQYEKGNPAKSVPFPGKYKDYHPFPGGDPTQPSPAAAYDLDGVHPRNSSYQLLIGNAIDQFLGGWLRAGQPQAAAAWRHWLIYE
jgi:lysophospholipase L1-like esterase